MDKADGSGNRDCSGSVDRSRNERRGCRHSLDRPIQPSGNLTTFAAPQIGARGGGLR
jgi:hypothetical protein